MIEVIRIYYPKVFVRKWTRKVFKSREKFKEVEKALISARIPLTTQELFAIADFYSILSFFIGISIGFLIALMVPPEFMIYIARYTPFYTFVIMNFHKLKYIYFIFIIVLFGFTAYKTTKYAILSYPFFVSKRRRSEIELYLPHAINMMYGMAVGGLSINEIVKTIAESKHIFGELSREFIVIMEMIEVFKKNIYEGMRFVRDTTPSPQLSSFLDNMIFILEGGGRLSDFLRRKSEELVEERERVFEMFIDFLGMMAEVYISIFMVLPLFLLIVLAVMRLVGTQFLEIYKIAIIFALPLATVMFVYLIRSSLPLPKVKLEEFERRFELIKANVIDEFRKSYSIDNFKRLKKKILKILLHPFIEDIYRIELRIFIIHISMASLIVFLIAHNFLKIEHTILLTLSTFAIPLIFISEMKERLLRKFEERIPDMFSELAMLNEAGLTILDGLKVLSQTEMGLLTREIVRMKREIEWGILIPRAFIRFGLRVKSEILSKIVPAVVKALETAPTIKDAFHIVARYADSEVSFKKRMRSGTFLYIIIIYMCIAIFLVTAYMIITNFFQPFANVSGRFGEVAISMNVEELKNTFFQISLIVSILSGIVAGQIGEGNPLLGLKHSYIFAILTYATFNIM